MASNILSRAFQSASAKHVLASLQRRSSISPKLRAEALLTVRHGCCQQHHAFPSNTMRMFSASTSGGGSGFSMNPMDWWRDRQVRKDDEKFKKRVAEMADMERFRLLDMIEEVEESIGTWNARFASMTGGGKEIESAKTMMRHVKGVMEIMGTDASLPEIEKMTKIEKLKAANIADCTPEDINVVLHQFSSMCTMQKVLRKRKREGKSLPLTPESAQMIVQKEAMSVMTPNQRDELRKQMGRNIKF